MTEFLYGGCKLTDFDDYLVDYDELRRLVDEYTDDEDEAAAEAENEAEQPEPEQAEEPADEAAEDEDTPVNEEPDGNADEALFEFNENNLTKADDDDDDDLDSDDFVPSFSKANRNSVYGTYDVAEDDAEGEEESDEISDGKKKTKIKLPVKLLLIFACLCLLVSSAYAVVVRGNIPFVVKWRNIWIETAMTTDQHKWLATSFFPGWLIDEVMDARVDVRDIGTTEIEKGKKNDDGTPASGEESDNAEPEDILGQSSLTVGELDSHGNEVLVNDLEQNIVILKVKTSNFVGRLVLIDDPSRVFIATTDNKEVRGKFICDYLADEGAIVGMNASGFYDPGGVGIGGVVTARTVAKGEYWGTYSSNYITVGFDRKDRLIVGEFSNWEERDMRDAFQYHPALIINGDKVIEGASGWGLQPRTVIGQAKNGMVLFLVVDGRQVGYSLGATMGDCADILEEYGAYNAGACDGGSSSVLAYDGVILNKPSTNMPTGRYLPNAWLVKRK